MLALKFSLLALCSTAVLGFEYTVGVGQDETTGQAGVGFDPSRTVSGGTDDLLVFRMFGGQHHVVSSSFDAPCSQVGTFDTGLVTAPNNTLGPSDITFNTTVHNSSTVLYFSDIAGDNCYQGAVFCINTDESSNSTTSCAAFKAAALALGAAQGVPTYVHSAISASSTASSASAATSAILTGSAASASKTASGTAPSASTSGKTSGAMKSVVGGAGAAGALAAGFVGVFALL